MFKLFKTRNKAELTFCQKAHTQQAPNKANKQLLLKQGRVQHGNTTRTRTTRSGTQLQEKRGTTLLRTTRLHSLSVARASGRLIGLSGFLPRKGTRVLRGNEWSWLAILKIS